jgi:hypothetical protein
VILAYVLTKHEYCDTEVMGVYSSEELAQRSWPEVDMWFDEPKTGDPIEVVSWAHVGGLERFTLRVTRYPMDDADC